MTVALAMSDEHAPIRDLVAELSPGAEILEIRTMGPDSGVTDATQKGGGYGVPVLVTLRDAGGSVTKLVVHGARADEFGHDRRADRAAGLLLAYDTYPLIPRHVRAVDVGAITASGGYVSLRGAGEFYLVTTYAEGEIYAQDLRRIAQRGHVTAIDTDRCDALVAYLAELHGRRLADPMRYRRAVRDLLGHGEGIFGIADGYPPDVPAAGAERLRAIERRCLEWRFRLRDRGHRLARTHGDFHPFNVVFEGPTELALLDASRGCVGDPADDVACMAINYAFFALLSPGSWARGFGPLWRRFWHGYLERTGDEELLEVVAPFFAWRGLVLANPTWYPAVGAEARDALLRFVERALDADRFEPGWASEMIAA